MNPPDLFKNFDSKAKFLKVHQKNGDMYILNNWMIDYQGEKILGNGDYLDYNREKISSRLKIEGQENSFYDICFDDISLIETNKLEYFTGGIAAISIVGVPMAIFTTICLTNPKACFGSCPTFYTKNNGNWNVMAEGFSSSILPVFEEKDIDMLYWADTGEKELSLKLTNEALETHVIRYANLLAFPLNENERVFSTYSGQFYKTDKIIPPAVCVSEKGSCLKEVSSMDHEQWFSEADDKNLAGKEEIILSFDDIDFQNRGLIIGSKQTLLTTYLFYQGLAYAGSNYGYFCADVENGNTLLEKRIRSIWDKLGGIEIFMEEKPGNWEKVGEINEMGPIATDVHLIKLPETIKKNITVKLKMTKGLWRIDYLALANISEEVEPFRLKPELVMNDSTADQKALTLLNDSSEYLVTYPGDTYFLNYNLPERTNYEVFLESKGYYLEWMRDEWLLEEDLGKLRLMFALPGLYLRLAAKGFKEVESDMEDKFWGSRYVKY